MAKRRTTRRQLSAGAALVTGLGMVGIATATPAQADSTDLVYTCTTPIGDQDFDITLSATDTASTTVGETVSLAPTGTLTLNSDIANAMAGFLQWHHVEGEANDVEATVSNGTDEATVTADLSIDRTHIWDGSAWIQDDTPDLPISGTGGDVEADTVGEYTITAPDSFSATFRGYNADEEQQGDAINSDCTYKSGEKLIDTLTVTEEGEEPEEPAEEDDWFNEPASLPLVDNVFTVAGTASKAGTLSIEVLSGTGEGENRAPDEVLETYSWDVEEGEVSEDFDLVENADYVRIISEDCVDQNGKTGEDPHVDEEGVGNGCSVLYTAPWAEGGGNGDGDDDMGNDDGAGDDAGSDDGAGDDAGSDDGAGDDAGSDDGAGDDAGSDDGAGDDAGSDDAGDDAAPEVPSVVQTDGFQRTAAPQQDNTLAFALGGLLLAGAGAGTIVVARRRAVSSR